MRRLDRLVNTLYASTHLWHSGWPWRKKDPGEDRAQGIGTPPAATRHHQDRDARGRHRDEEGSIVEKRVDRSGEDHIGQQNGPDDGNRSVGPGQSRRIELPAPEPNHHHRPE